jgi:maltose-binding protein MalE
MAEGRWGLLGEAQEVALIPPKHPNYPAVEDVIWQGVRETLLGNKGVKEALKDTEEMARRAAEGA